MGDADSVLDEIEEFLTGQRHDAVDVDRVLATVVFSDIVESTRAAERLGDRQWRALLDQTRLGRRTAHRALPKPHGEVDR